MRHRGTPRSLRAEAPLSSIGAGDHPGGDTLMRRSTAVIAALTMVLAACGDGGGDDEGTAAACDAYVAVDQAFFVDEDVEAGTVALQEFHDNAPDEVAAQVEPFLTRLREDGAAGLESEELVPAETAADDYAFENCGDTDVELSAVDYALSGAPSELDAGRIAFRLTNDTQTNEVHEALLLRKKDGVAGTPHEALSRGLGATISIDDTLAAFEPFAMVGGGLAEPAGGDTEDVFLVDVEPGEYILVCLLPVDTAQNLEPYFGGEEVEAERHLDRGMFTEISVS